jgi:hypothetical protein
MPTFKQVIDCRRIDVALVPDAVRLDMLRQQIRFRIEDFNGSDDDSKEAIIAELEAALHEHTQGLFSIEVEYLNSYTPEPAMAVSIYFERHSDKQKFLRDHLTLAKLAS